MMNPAFFSLLSLGWPVGAYHMQNSTPAVPKRPQWIQISDPLLLVLLLNLLLQQKGNFFLS